ncbi:hypothetical protein [Campylobacter lari]|uniref:hypothetical protein n=1 Tax=Campylobacter lari TaxID=201 RepID=UPI000581E6A1|nr:hypothetical protein [Campylobacter lari]AJC88853.1 hypothetical protein CONCH_0410 [Campylobacter lari subsp. concheus LMG 11760]EAI4428449.1 hypothetical protein [Campylobacter lari]EAI5529409.1 hypothetical protein [Campylobacter lari]EGK1189955.1 hypothetical protein [Campylobacter lari]MCR2080372.1 hypothetical protein [Campylobacter lari subsp. concheus]
MFGFNEKEDFIPKIFRDLEQKSINYIFLNLYNSLVEDDLKIPYIYAKKADCLRNIFELKIQNMSIEKTLRFSKIKQFCPYSHKIIKAYKEGKLNQMQFEAKMPKYALAKLIQNVFLSPSFTLPLQVAFEAFVYDKICKSNTKSKVKIYKNIIIINEKMAVMPLFCKDSDKDIELALQFIKDNSFERFYIVYPRNKNFTQYEEIRYFLYENNKTLLKLVPYTINNQILRRC